MDRLTVAAVPRPSQSGGSLTGVADAERQFSVDETRQQLESNLHTLQMHIEQSGEVLRDDALVATASSGSMGRVVQAHIESIHAYAATVSALAALQQLDN